MVLAVAAVVTGPPLVLGLVADAEEEGEGRYPPSPSSSRSPRRGGRRWAPRMPLPDWGGEGGGGARVRRTSCGWARRVGGRWTARDFRGSPPDARPGPTDPPFPPPRRSYGLPLSALPLLACPSSPLNQRCHSAPSLPHPCPTWTNVHSGFNHPPLPCKRYSMHSSAHGRTGQDRDRIHSSCRLATEISTMALAASSTSRPIKSQWVRAALQQSAPFRDLRAAFAASQRARPTD